MTGFDDFCTSLESVVDEFGKKGVQLRLRVGERSHTVTVLGDGATALSQAREGIDGVEELALDAAEHHPYWRLLYHCTQISRLVIERWNSEMTGDEIRQIEWSAVELENAARKLAEA